MAKRLTKKQKEECRQVGELAAAIATVVDDMADGMNTYQVVQALTMVLTRTGDIHDVLTEREQTELDKDVIMLVAKRTAPNDETVVA